MDIPKEKNYPADSVQCDICGGNGCKVCDNKGWLTPKEHPDGRHCLYPKCNKPLPPTHIAVYCTDQCASNDA
jgi:hypothetical protein